MPGPYRATGKGPYRTTAPVFDAGMEVRPGDLMFRNGDGYDAPASTFTWNTDLATTQEGFHDAFRGVSTAGRRTDQTTDGDRADGMILATGEVEYPCDALASAAGVGSYVGVAKQTGDALENQKVVVVATANLAIGELTEDAAVGATSLKFELRAVKPLGGVQAPA